MNRILPLLVLALLLTACGLNERGPWLDWNGNEMRATDMLEYDGFGLCDQQTVIFIKLFGDQYAKDPEGILGELTSPETGEPLTFELLDTVPEDTEATGITHAGREIYLGEDRPDYIYVRLPNGQTERWTRAENTCEREEPLTG